LRAIVGAGSIPDIESVRAHFETVPSAGWREFITEGPKDLDSLLILFIGVDPVTKDLGWQAGAE
jgi:hypothetical protein